MAKSSHTYSIVNSLFYGNYFYGLCAVALSIEAMLQQLYPLNSYLYFILVFCLTVLFYTKAYITENPSSTGNERDQWYYRQKQNVTYSQISLTIICAGISGWVVYTHFDVIKDISWLELGLIIVFPLVALLYYGTGKGKFAKYNLRNIGWLKPFVIGFSWAGVVTLYPVIFYNIINDTEFKLTLVACLLTLKNFMFVSVLCILFDIKDYAADHSQKLSTFVVRKGLRNTIFYIVIPLSLIGLGTFVYYGITRQFHPFRITLNVFPFVFLIMGAYSLHNRKSLLYYLTVIDGLMLVKALFGSVAVVYF